MRIMGMHVLDLGVIMLYVVIILYNCGQSCGAYLSKYKIELFRAIFMEENNFLLKLSSLEKIVRRRNQVKNRQN